MNRARWAILAGCSLSVALLLVAEARRSKADAPTADVLAARVGDRPITVADVESIVDRLPGRNAFSLTALARARAETLAQLVNKALVSEYLDRKQFLPAEKPWEARWVRYLAEQFSDDDVQAYFERHRREFDGTELRVSHILWKLPAEADPATITASLARAQHIREEIVAGRTSFAAAAATHSEGPSRDRGGDLGWIGRRGPMVESFSRAAFALETTAVSGPIVTPFGVHLIQCTEMKPGRLRWDDANRAVREALSSQRFQQLADEMRSQIKVDYTGRSPYFDPATGRVAP